MLSYPTPRSDGVSKFPEVDQVAQLNRTFTQALRTPVPGSTDSDGVVLALETARALEARGDMNAAAKWLRRAAREAESQGNDKRVLELAHVAADMASATPDPPLSPVPPPVRRSEPSDSSEPTIPKADVAPGPPRVRSHQQPVARSDSPMNTIADDDDSATPTMTPPGPAPKQTQHGRVPSPSISLVCRFSISLDEAPSNAMRVGAVRVAIKRGTSTKKGFSVEELEPGQSPPAGTIEAMLIIPGDVDGTRELTIQQLGKVAPPRR
jgi:hypothetical protein